MYSMYTINTTTPVGRLKSTVDTSGPHLPPYGLCRETITTCSSRASAGTVQGALHPPVRHLTTKQTPYGIKAPPTCAAAATRRSFSVEASFNRALISAIDASAEQARASAPAARCARALFSALRADTSWPRDTTRRFTCGSARSPCLLYTSPSPRD